MDLLATLCSLLGKTLEDPATAALLASFPDRRIGKPAGGDQYVVVRSAGFDLLFRSPRPRQPRVLHSVFLFRDDEERHRAFTDLPYGIGFGDTQAALVERLGPPSRDSIAILGTPQWAAWSRDGYEWYCRYDGPAGTVRHMVVSRESA